MPGFDNFSENIEVRQIVGDLYRVFSEPNDLLTDPSCSPHREDLVKDACQFAREDTPIDILDNMAFCLISTVGTPQTLRYYLPKIFDDALLALPVLGITQWWMIAGKLPLADFETWTAEQRRLTLAAMKLWIAAATMQDQGGIFDAAEILQMSMKDVVSLYDPYYGSDEWWRGDGHNIHDRIAFLIEAESRCAGPR